MALNKLFDRLYDGGTGTGVAAAQYLLRMSDNAASTTPNRNQ